MWDRLPSFFVLHSDKPSVLKLETGSLSVLSQTAGNHVGQNGFHRFVLCVERSGGKHVSRLTRLIQIGKSVFNLEGLFPKNVP